MVLLVILLVVFFGFMLKVPQEPTPESIFNRYVSLLIDIKHAPDMTHLNALTDKKQKLIRDAKHYTNSADKYRVGLRNAHLSRSIHLSNILRDKYTNLEPVSS